MKVIVQVRLQTRIFLPPDELYDLLTQPDNSKVFRNIKVIHYRFHGLSCLKRYFLLLSPRNPCSKIERSLQKLLYAGFEGS